MLVEWLVRPAAEEMGSGSAGPETAASRGLRRVASMDAWYKRSP